MAVRRALVTGAGGFVGQWLCRELVREGWEVVGSSLIGAPPHGVLSAEDHALVRWRRDDLLHADAVRSTIDDAQPDAVFHLAGVAFVPAAGRDPALALDTNVGIAVRLLAVIEERRSSGTLDPVVLVVGSGEQYGRHDISSLPLPEDAECRPASPYAASKLAQEQFALAAFRRAGVRVVCTRSFNHSGPGQSPNFVIPGLIKRVLAAKAAGEGTTTIGNTSVARDFLHVEDVVRAYLALVEDGLAGEVYNVSGGKAVTIAQVAAQVAAAVGVDIEFVPDSGLQRAVDVPHLSGRNNRIRDDTGWIARLGLADIIRDVIASETL
ncbi:MAG: NAD-dependent epimerase/dehydratase family protein [Gemmatimonadetes bacterium]|nr:NAD-dependent epimerase/dehydratase family protein [Gemmatimonadota bacterium]